MDEEVVGLVFELNLMEDFLEFIDWPDHEQYLSRQPLRHVASRIEAFQIARDHLQTAYD
jgi:hypothetical protein